MPRHLTRIVVGIAGVGLLASCGSGGDPLASSSTATSGTSTASGSSAGPIVVGSADFSESQLLAEIYAGALTAKGITATTKLNIGAREIYLKALQDGSVDLVPEYTGARAYYYDNTFSETDPDKVYAALQRLVPAQFTLLTKSAAEDNDSINVTKATADKLKLSSIADLAAVAGDLTLGAPPEFQTRPQGIPGLAKTYGVTFKTFRPLKGQQLVQALKNGQVDAANIFSTDPAIAANGFVTLTDDKRLFGSQNVVPLIAASKDTPAISAVLDAVSTALTTATLADLVKQVDVDKADPATVAKGFLTKGGLA
ncbi:MAG: ABC transporter substrate-binding protein [Tetrasphaera sp.]|nr:ABC transporter substrate-binding protein [Tetrasphaera sp.]